MSTSCDVCYYDDISRDEMLKIDDCGHAKCKECYGGYLVDNFKSGFGCVATECPAKKCGLIVPKEHFKMFLDDK